MCSIPLHIRFDKIDGFIKIYDGIRYFVILGHSWFEEICDSIENIISEKRGITDSFLPIEKIVTFHDVMILIKSVFNEIKNHYYNIFLEKGSRKDKSHAQYFQINFCILYTIFW